MAEQTGLLVAMPQRFKAQYMCMVTVTRATRTYDHIEATAVHTIRDFHLKGLMVQ